MPIISVKDKRKQKKIKTKKNKGEKSYSERVRAKLFCCEFKLGFVQLICKASLIFKLNLELALSIINYTLLLLHFIYVATSAYACTKFAVRLVTRFPY